MMGGAYKMVEWMKVISIVLQNAKLPLVAAGLGTLVAISYREYREHRLSMHSMAKDQLKALLDLMDNDGHKKSRLITEQVFAYKFGKVIPYFCIEWLLTTAHPTASIKDWIIGERYLRVDHAAANIAWEDNMSSQAKRRWQKASFITAYFAFMIMGAVVIMALGPMAGIVELPLLVVPALFGVWLVWAGLLSIKETERIVAGERVMAAWASRAALAPPDSNN